MALTRAHYLPCNIPCERAFGLPSTHMIVFGIKFWAWGSQLTQQVWRCAKCGYNGQFIQKKGMKFITLYWIIPTIPVSGISEIGAVPAVQNALRSAAAGRARHRSGAAAAACRAVENAPAKSEIYSPSG